MKINCQMFLLLLLVFPQLSNAASTGAEAYIDKPSLIITNPATTTEGSIWKSAANTLQKLNIPAKQEILSSIMNAPLPAAIWLFSPAIIGLFSLQKKP